MSRSLPDVVPPFRRVELALDSNPRRAHSSVNVRYDDKVVFDAVQSWLSLVEGESFSQWQVFTRVLASALSGERIVVPREFLARDQSA